jgi:glycosyltransferase involved in cell wall biosynthesis
VLTMTDPATTKVDRSAQRSALPINLAFHYLGCAVLTDDGRIGVPSRIGPLLASMSASVDRLSVVAYQPSPQPSFEDGVEYTIDAANVSLVALGPKGGRGDYLARRRRVRSIVQEASEHWDVVLYYLHNRRAHLVHKSARCPRIAGFVVGTTARPAHPAGTPASERFLSRLTGVWTERQMKDVLRHARLGIINSEELLAEVRGVPHVRQVYLSTRPERFTYSVRDRFQGDIVNLMVAGRLELEKGVHDALDAFVALRERVPNVRLHFAGDGTERSALEARVRDLGLGEVVVFHGWIPADERLFDLYRQMDVLLLPSFAAYEGFPCVVWEAMAHSVIVVSTPVRGPRAALRHEEDLLFVPPRQPQAIVDAVARLAQDAGLRERLISSAFPKAQATSVEQMTRTIVEGVTAAWPELRASSPD